jgi:hypothetical protein
MELSCLNSVSRARNQWKALVSGSRQLELNRIERENAAILRRIQDQNNRASEFSVRKMEAGCRGATLLPASAQYIVNVPSRTE